ncbi:MULTISPECIES: inverse autotransporter beta domain-containing protein [Symbiopectobacterium]|uniref:inverse autotransporter beta domain-containing protein n=1 Tax=Symbiopectobacterium TaxID=801 RepID=UPI0020794995|nr:MULTISPECIES: inverse autotransporter beta domain-containing protein [Symbiopectobacterium]
MMYEKYRRNDVALFGKDQRQKNPHALTAGINYTPFPLLTVGADHRMGKGSQSSSNISAQLNYRLGESWRSHINPSAVAASRTLAGSRYDLVERNNNIVLDYQKQELLHLTLPEQITGRGGSATSVTANVTSKYAIDRIEWDSSALTSAGGPLSPVSVQTADIRLPPYQLTRGGLVNTYTLSAVAYDTQGNMSPRATLRITVMPGEPTLLATNLAVTKDNAVANGLDTNAVQAVVTDAGSNPLSGQVVRFLTDNGATVSNVAVTTNAEGIDSTTIHSPIPKWE